MFHQLYSFGSNASGQLGLGDTEDRCLPTHVSDRHEPILDLDGGANHTILITPNSVLVAGSNTRGQLGLPQDTYPCQVTRFTTHPFFNPSFISSLGQISFACCGWETSFVGLTSGHVVAFGCNRYQQLGLNHVSQMTASPTLLVFPLNTHIRKVASGVRHSLFLTADGIVYGCGSCRKGELGYISDTKAKSMSLMLISSLKDIMDIACGFQISCALDQTGNVYVMGTNKHGELSSSTTPQAFAKLDMTHIIPYSVSSSWSSICVLGRQGQVVWGRNDRGQCALGSKDAIVEPTNIPAFATQVIHSLCLGSEHALCLTEHGECYVWGWNEHGNLGLGHTKDVLEPLLLTLPQTDAPCVSIGAGCGHSFIVIERKQM